MWSHSLADELPRLLLPLVCAWCSYVYAIDGRGRQFTDKWGITAKLADAAVDTSTFHVTRVQPSGKVQQSKQVRRYCILL
jgi:hypothetical protein